MASEIISVEYDLPLPNDYLVDHSFSEGKSRKTTYHGPDKVYLQIGEDGTEKNGPLTADDIMDGRPMPADVVDWFEVDCRENPLICQLRGPIVNELQEEHTGEVPHPGSPDVPGYKRFTYSTPIMPQDIFNKKSIKVVDGNVTVDPFTVLEQLHERDVDITWDMLRINRDRHLTSSDGKVTDDMPEALKEEWKEYRQLLRDLPSTLESAGVHPNIAFFMFPDSPDSENPTEGDRKVAADPVAAAALAAENAG
jgi:hypothetical protein